MKKLILLCFLLAISGIVFAQEKETLETGPLLFLEPEENCTVYLDGQDIGTTPLLISDISSKNSSLKLLGKDSYGEFSISFKASKSDITNFAPKLGVYMGRLYIKTARKGVKYLIDGQPVEYSSGEGLLLKAGHHTIVAEKEGFFPTQIPVEIPRLDDKIVDLSLFKAVEVSFTSIIPTGTKITFVNEDSEAVVHYTENDEITLSPGKWKGKLENPIFQTAEFEISVTDRPVNITTVLKYFQPKVNLVGLTGSSTVFLGDRDVTAQLNGTVLPLPVGQNRITIYRNKFKPISEVLTATGNEEIQLVLDYQKNTRLSKEQKLMTSIVMMASGVTMLAGGFILDNVILSGIPPSDSLYSNIQYTSYGIGGAGLSLTLTGTIFGISYLKD